MDGVLFMKHHFPKNQMMSRSNNKDKLQVLKDWISRTPAGVKKFNALYKTPKKTKQTINN